MDFSPVCRNIPLIGLNITNVLLSYYIEFVNSLTTCVTLSLLWVLCLFPIPLLLAQIIYTFLHCCGSLCFALGSAISCVQVIYVTKFELLFPLDPKVVGQRIFHILAASIVIPDTAVGIYSIMNGLHVDERVILFTQGDRSGTEIKFMITYSGCWILLFLILSFIGFLFIPIWFKFKQLNNRNHLPPSNVISIRRYLLGSLGFLTVIIVAVVINKGNNTHRLVTPGRLFLISYNMLLAFHLSEKDAMLAAKRYLFNLFNIEAYVNGREIIATSTNNVPQPSLNSINNMEVIPAQMLPLSTFINVLPA